PCPFSIGWRGGTGVRFASSRTGPRFSPRMGVVQSGLRTAHPTFAASSDFKSHKLQSPTCVKDYHNQLNNPVKPTNRYQNANCMRVKSTFSSCRVTAAGALAPGPPPPLKTVCEKLVLNCTFRFKYQFRPTDQAAARRAEVSGLEKSGKASSSMLSSAYRPTSCSAPQSPWRGLNGCRGTTPPL